VFASTTSPFSLNFEVSSRPNTVVHLSQAQYNPCASEGSIPWGANIRLDPTTLNLVLNSIEEQLLSKELKDLAFQILWDIRFEIEQIEIRLVINSSANC
jgi:hypothetical protein